MSQSSIGPSSRKWPSRMRRKAASEYLFEVHGVTLSASTLAKLAVLGGGPKFWKDGAFPIYGAEHLDEFAVLRLGKLRRSTSDAQVAQTARSGDGQ